jgi:transposase
MGPEGKRHRVSVTAQEIISAAQQSVASAGIAKELILTEKAATVLYLQNKRERISEALVEACESVRIEDLDIIKSIDGIRNVTGATFLAELGDFSKFGSYKQIIAFAGLDPSINQSGQHEGVSKISKRGNRHLRRIIFTITMCAIRSDNVFREYFLKRKKEGLAPMKAVLACSHKIIRVIFAMLTHRTFFKKEVAVV